MPTISADGIKLIQEFEAFSAKAYLDVAGVPTIGYGTTVYPDGTPVALGDTCTVIQANKYMMHDLEKFEEAITNGLNPTVAPTQNQFDAMISLCYNIGIKNFLSSSVLRHINSGEIEEAQHSFLFWDEVHEHGVRTRVRGLERRRALEAALFGPLSFDELVSRYALDV